MDLVLLGIIAVSTLIKLIFAFAVDSDPAVLDEGAYMRLARTLVSEGRFEGTFRPPLYPGFLAVFLKLGLGTLGVRIAQVLLSGASVWLIYALAGQYLDRRASRIAAGMFAFNPVLIAFSHRLWSETLYIFFLLIALLLLVRGVKDLRRHWPWIGAGLAFGLAGLTRPMILTFLPLLLPWALYQIARQRRERWNASASWRASVTRFAILGAACCAIVLPWTLRNARLSGAFILVDTNAPFNFLVGTQSESAFVDKDDLWSERFARVDGKRYEEYVLENPARAQDLALAAALANIESRPLRFLQKSWWEAGHLWTLDSFLLRHLRNGWYPGVSASFIPLITITSVAFFVVLILSGFAGLASGPPSSYRSLAILLALHSTMLFGLTYSLSRYGVPLQAVLTIPAAAFLAGPRSSFARLRSDGRVRSIALAAAVVFVCIGWFRDLPLMSDLIRNGGVEHRFRMQRMPANAVVSQD